MDKWKMLRDVLAVVWLLILGFVSFVCVPIFFWTILVGALTILAVVQLFK